MDPETEFVLSRENSQRLGAMIGEIPAKYALPIIDLLNSLPARPVAPEENPGEQPAGAGSSRPRKR